MTKRQQLSRFSSASILAFSMSLLAVSLMPTAAMAVNPAPKANPTQVYRAQALQHIANGQDQAALESYKAAINAARSQYGQESTYLSELYFEMGNLARSKGQSEVARDCYHNAVKYRPNDVPARLQLAELERNTKNVQGAYEETRKALELEGKKPFSNDVSTSISNREMLLCLQSCGRPAEAAKIAAQLHRAGKGAALIKSFPKLPAAAPMSVNESNGEGGGAVVTSAVSVTANSALHWAPGLRKKADEEAASKKKAEAEAAKRAKDLQAADEAKRKQAEAALQKAEQDKKAKDHAKDEAERKSKQKSKDAKKEDAKKSAAKGKQAAAPAFVEPQLNTGTLKTTAKTIKPDKGEKADKAEKSDKAEEKTPPKGGHLGVGAVTEKTEKPVEEKHESGRSENEPVKPKAAPVEEKQQPVAMPQSVPIQVPVVSGKKGKGHPGVLVPPPPATPFIIPSFQPPQGVPIQAAPPPAAKPKPKPKPVEKEPEKEAAEEPAPKAGGDTGDFLINWGGDSAKKKHAK